MGLSTRHEQGMPSHGRRRAPTRLANRSKGRKRAPTRLANRSEGSIYTLGPQWVRTLRALGVLNSSHPQLPPSQPLPVWLYQSLNASCYNNCSGQHACDVGVCDCRSGSAMDCAIEPPAGNNSSGFIYIYGVDPDLGLRHFRMQAARSRRTTMRGLSGPLPGDPIYAAEAVFIDSLLRDWSVRTTDPSKATLFFVPSYQYYYDGNLVLPAQHVQRLRRKLRYWGRGAPNGADHIFFFTGDKGACGCPRGPIYISHFGFTLPWACMGHEEPSDCERNIALAKALRRREEETVPCADDRSIVVPPFWTRADKRSIARVQAKARRHERLGSWPYELFFTGNVRAARPYINPWLNLTYSQGVRQALFASWHNYSRFQLASREPTDNVYASARFCLAPSGDGFGWRLMKIMMLGGCVPLIIQPHIRQPFDSLLPYDNFSLRLAPRDIPFLAHILQDVSTARHAAMRRAMQEHAHAFSWREHGGGNAYDMLIRALRGAASSVGGLRLAALRLETLHPKH